MARRGVAPFFGKKAGESEIPMNERRTCKKASAFTRALALLTLSSATTANAVEPEKQPIFANIVNGLLCGTSSTNQCKVPAGQRLIILNPAVGGCAEWPNRWIGLLWKQI